MIEPGHSIPLWNGQGSVTYVSHHGSDRDIVAAARTSYAAESKGDEQDKKLLMYLYRHLHSSPFELASITFVLKVPIFVFRQIVRHRTAKCNEMSARYTVLKDEFYIPEKWRAQDKVNKQGSVESVEIDNGMCTDLYNQAVFSCYEAYERLLAAGVAREMARCVLPVSIFTEVRWQMDMNNFTKFLRLRDDGHAQSETRDVAVAMKQIARELFPWTIEAYERFQIKTIDTLEKEKVV
jgi:thymidylate synthase (FAD)